jgi:hypothetical protein
MGDIIALGAYLLLYYFITKHLLMNERIVTFATKTILKFGMVYFLNGDLVLYDQRYPSGYTVLLPSIITFIIIIIVLSTIIMDALKLVSKG